MTDTRRGTRKLGFDFQATQHVCRRALSLSWISQTSFFSSCSPLSIQYSALLKSSRLFKSISLFLSSALYRLSTSLLWLAGVETFARTNPVWERVTKVGRDQSSLEQPCFCLLSSLFYRTTKNMRWINEGVIKTNDRLLFLYTTEILNLFRLIINYKFITVN